jgi:NADH-quinone oxidoreductase subunit C
MSGLHEKLKEKFGDAVVSIHADHGDETAVVKREAFIEIVDFIRDDSDFDMSMLIDLTAVDGLGMKWKPRFEMVYHFYSLKKNHRLRLKVQVDEKDALMPTLTAHWPIANWMEREAWDMYGIEFKDHPDLRRILMYEGFQGHPLRKDYPYNKRQPLIGPMN